MVSVLHVRLEIKFYLILSYLGQANIHVIVYKWTDDTGKLGF